MHNFGREFWKEMGPQDSQYAEYVHVFYRYTAVCPAPGLTGAKPKALSPSSRGRAVVGQGLEERGAGRREEVALVHPPRRRGLEPRAHRGDEAVRADLARAVGARAQHGREAGLVAAGEVLEGVGGRRAQLVLSMSKSHLGVRKGQQ